MNEEIGVTEGAYFEALGCYLVLERSESKITRVFFSVDQPSGGSELAEGLVRHVTDGMPCPKVELDLSGFNDFRRKVSLIVMDIPRGGMMTYGQVAAMAGHPGASRAVGQVMAANPFLIFVPCHRVVAKQGLGGFVWGLETKEKLLEAEAAKP
jgi:methylated-DNA-[protein]-cysteine S-methyltransferase